METTANFEAGLQAAYDELHAEGRLTLRDRHVYRKLQKHRTRAIERVHHRTREHYLATSGAIVDAVKGIDWTAVKDWLKANWVQIAQFIISIVFFFL